VTDGVFVCKQDSIDQVHRMESKIFLGMRDLVLVPGMVVSLDDWKWKYNGKDLPLRRQLSNGGTGWTADCVVSTPDHYVLAVRKRAIVSKGPKETVEVATDKMLGRLNHHIAGMLFVMDRGYTTLARARLRA